MMKIDPRGIGLLLILSAIFTGCGEVPDPVVNSLARDGGKGGVHFVGFDASPPLIDALAAGQIQGLVLQDPVKMGYRGVKTLIEHLEGETVEPSISTGELLATPENMREPEVAERLNPPRTAHNVGQGGQGPGQAKYRLMVIPKGTSHLHWQAVHTGARRAAQEVGSVEIIWMGPTKEDDRSAQISLVENAIASKVDGIVIAPLDSQALARPIEDAATAGIPVVIIDSGLKSNKPVAFVATDNYRGGVLAAERLGQLLGGEGRIILLRYAPNSEATEQREAGFVETIATKFPNITYLSDNRYAGATADSAQQESQRLVQQFRGQVDGIFCPNESSTVGMLRALKDAGLLRNHR